MKRASYIDRKEYILGKKFNQYLIPSIMITLAASLSEFVDGIIVSNLLDVTALSIVNMGMPVMFLGAVCFVLLGNGGSIQYVTYLGKMQKQEAEKALTVSMFMLVVSALALTTVGYFSCDQLIHLAIGNQPSLYSDLIQYVRILLLSLPVIIPVVGLTYFISGQGHPTVAMLVHITANVANVMFDILFIKGLGMGVNGAALATLSGYLLALLLLLICKMLSKFELPFCHVGIRDFRCLKEIATGGVGSAIGQLGFAAKLYCSNYLASQTAGAEGLLLISLCMQTESIVSVIIGGIGSTLSPIVGFLNGKHDYHGIHFVMKRALKYTALLLLIMGGMMAAFPEMLAALYNVPPQSITETLRSGIRIFNVSNVLRGIAIIFMLYAQAVGIHVLSSTISLMDGFLFILPCMFILSHFKGIYGLCIAYPLTAALILCYIVLYSRHLEKESGGKYHGLLMIPTEEDALGEFDITIENETQIVDCVIQLTDYAKTCGFEDSKANLLGLALEEMTVFTLEYEKEHGLTTNIDMQAVFCSSGCTLNFRSMGAPFSPAFLSVDLDQEPFDHIALLHGIMKDIHYDNTLGMNNTRMEF